MSERKILSRLYEARDLLPPPEPTIMDKLLNLKKDEWRGGGSPTTGDGAYARASIAVRNQRIRVRLRLASGYRRHRAVHETV